MSDAAIFLGWSRPIQNRETDALELLERLAIWLKELRTSGQITSYVRTLLEPHGGGLAGFVLIEGDVPKLQALKQTEAWNDGVSRLSLVLEGVMVNHAIVGAGVEREDARLKRLAKQR
ncbi:hypothetical protein GA0061098_1014191 [Bradyrhizobium shewense]|uniref:Uncharacterized protein n=1 Tax=Bradyrhizobium shewense TaxID=1761772 RepID=A0A1C3XEC1_9BRAD|nr:hypothetical protein [Bradyrhizobium shewense]SCB50622.1 hypothetical protein GA0061098_1014191 [Bradyrhizobium shewense]